jgi:general secretion pathway protein F
MPNFRYRALRQNGEIVSDSISAASAQEVFRQIEYMGLVPIEAITEQSAAMSRMVALLSRPRPHDVTVFTRDLALLLRAGARLYDALDLLAGDSDVGSLRPTVARIRTAVASGESFADALSRHRDLFPPMYVALVRVGEASGTLDHLLQSLADERARAEALRRRLLDALQYPAFVLVAACGVLVFFCCSFCRSFLQCCATSTPGPTLLWAHFWTCRMLCTRTRPSWV